MRGLEAVGPSATDLAMRKAMAAAVVDATDTTAVPWSGPNR